MSQHLIIGASHTLYISQVLGTIEADLTAASRGAIEIRDTGLDDIWKLLFLTPRTGFLTFERRPQGLELRVSDSLRRELVPFDRPESHVVCLIGGNEHNLEFLTAHPQPFDFHHPRGPAPRAGRQVVPGRVMRQRLAASMEMTRLTLHALRPMFQHAQLHMVAPPPPCPSEDFLRRRAEVFDFARKGVEDAGVRLKVYETVLDILRDIAADARYHWMPPPTSRRDAQGFLAEAFWQDATHATIEYYEPVVAELGVKRHASV